MYICIDVQNTPFDIFNKVFENMVASQYLASADTTLYWSDRDNEVMAT